MAPATGECIDAPLVIPAAPLATVAPRLTVALTRMLHDLHIDASAIARELATMAAVLEFFTLVDNGLSTSHRLKGRDTTWPTKT